MATGDSVMKLTVVVDASEAIETLRRIAEKANLLADALDDDTSGTTT